MRVRVLYPTAFISYVKKPALAGDIVDIPDGPAQALIGEGFAEKPNGDRAVEKATAEPGEKRRVGRPRKSE